MGSSVQPNFDSFINSAWGWGPACGGIFPFGAFSNIVVGSNPPYTATDFLSFYPKFGGQPIQVPNCTTVNGGTTLLLANPTPGIAAGQLLTGLGIAPGCVVQSYTQNTTEVTLGLPMTADAGSVAINFFVAPWVPIIVINAFIALASASLMQARWQSSWMLAMGLFVNHYCSLYMRSEVPSDGGVFNSAGQAAQAGLAVGITVQKGAGPVSQGLQVPGGLDDWGMWQETAAGINFRHLRNA